MTDQEGRGGARPPMRHELKTWPVYFNAILDGSKTFEVRKADRDFRVGDTLVLNEFDTNLGMLDGEYTERSIKAEVTYLLDDSSPFGFPGFVVMGIRRAEGRAGGAISGISPKMLTLAGRVAERMKEREGEDIEAWADRVMQTLEEQKPAAPAAQVERVARAIRAVRRLRGDDHMAATDEPSVADYDLARAAIAAVEGWRGGVCGGGA